MMRGPRFLEYSPRFFGRGGGGEVAATGVGFLRIVDNKET